MACLIFDHGTDRDYFLDSSTLKIVSLVILSVYVLTMKWQKIVLSPSVYIGADAKTAPYCVVNLVKARALPSFYALSGTVLEISNAYL